MSEKVFTDVIDCMVVSGKKVLQGLSAVATKSLKRLLRLIGYETNGRMKKVLQRFVL
jgi:hypothetical protein